MKNGRPNQYFNYRIAAAVELLTSRKIDFVVISDDNSRKNYNEPQDMKDELVASGITAEKIYLDYAGFPRFNFFVFLSSFGIKQAPIRQHCYYIF